MFCRVIIEGIGLSVILFAMCAIARMVLFDRFVIDAYWVGHTKAWTIPGTEEFKPYINKKDKIVKWAMGTVGFAILSAVVSVIMTLLLYVLSAER